MVNKSMIRVTQNVYSKETLMKKILSVLFFLSLMFLSFASCRNTETPTNTPDDTTEHDIFENVGSSILSGDISSAEELSASGKKYTYKENDIVLLSVKNESDSNRTVSVEVTYLDVNNEKIKTDIQTFEGFAAGWQKYFLFDPKITFDSFTCAVSSEVYDGECLGNKVEFGYSGVSEIKLPVTELMNAGDPSGYPTLQAKTYMIHSHGIPLDLKYNTVFIDNKGEISTIKASNAAHRKGGIEHEAHTPLFYTTEGKLEWPEELKGEIKVLFILNEVKSSQ